MSTPSGRTGYPKFNSSTDIPDGAAQDEALGDHFDELIGESVPALTDLPASGNWTGRTIWVAAVGVGFRVWNGSAWVPESGVKRTTGSGAVPPSPTSIMSLSLPAGTWLIRAHGYFNVATTVARLYGAELYNLTATASVDSQLYGAVGSGQWPVMAEDMITLTTTSTIQFRVSSSGADGTQLFSGGKLLAQQVVSI